MTSQSAKHSQSTTMNKWLMHTPTTSPKTPPTKLYDPSAPPESPQLPATPLYWCDPMTVTLVQIEENLQCLLCEWLKDDSIPFPRAVLGMLKDLKKKVRTRDEKREEKTNEEKTT